MAPFSDESRQEDTAEFLASKGITVIASLPCYSAKNVNLQRGGGVFAKSVAALIKLNSLGYGRAGSGLVLNLVYNPLGAFLPPEQAELEAKYRQELWDEFGVEFNAVFVMTNMPIKRFADFLYRRGELEDYMALLVKAFNPATLDSLMCRKVVSVGWDGGLYDCDFNQQLAMQMQGERGRPLTVFDVESLSELRSLPVQTSNHCFGCAAGRGSS